MGRSGLVPPLQRRLWARILLGAAVTLTALTAYTSDGQESSPSATVSKSIP